MIADALDAFAQIFSPPFRQVMVKSLLLTTAILVLLGFGLDRLALSMMHVGPAWLSALISILVALGVVVGMIVLAAPTASLVASFFLDAIAAEVERSIDPYGPPGRPLPVGPSILMGLRFAALSLAATIVVLALTLFTGVGLAAFFLVNGYLLGREYFELAAMRHMPQPQAQELRRRNWGQVYLAGLVVSAFVVVPILNLLTPLYATALLTRLVQADCKSRAAPDAAGRVMSCYL